MNRIKKAIVISTLCLLSFALFASGAAESAVSFSSLDFSTLSADEIVSSYESAKKDYSSSLEKLNTKLEKAYEERNADEYMRLMDLRESLEYPVVTREITETLVERILNTSDEKEKSTLSDFLYENSAYYSPTLTLLLKSTEGARTRTYTRTISLKPGETVTLPSSVSYDGYILKGWGITEDEVRYTPGEEIKMPYTDTVLYGVLTSGISFSDDVTGYYYTTEENTADVVIAASPDSSYVFAGWYDTKTGEELEGDSVTVEEGESKIYKAYWKSLSFTEGSIRYYSDNTAPADTQLRYTTELTVGGNTSLRGVTITLEENEGLDVLSGGGKCRVLKSGESVNLNFVIVLKGESGDEIQTTLTATDSDGNVWSTPVTFKIK